MVSTHNCCTGENCGVEVILGRSGRTRSAGRRVGEIGKAELFWHCVGDIYIG
jgi:hypothetical protein